HPGLDEPQTRPVRLLTQVAVPDDEVLAEGEVAPERREGEAELSEIVEMVLPDDRFRAEIAAPRHHEEREEREGAEPRAHEEPPAVQRALEVQREPHRQVEGEQRPPVAEGEGEEHGQLALQRVRAVELTTLLAESGAHARAKAG